MKWWHEIFTFHSSSSRLNIEYISKNVATTTSSTLKYYIFYAASDCDVGFIGDEGLSYMFTLIMTLLTYIISLSLFHFGTQFLFASTWETLCSMRQLMYKRMSVYLTKMCYCKLFVCCVRKIFFDITLCFYHFYFIFFLCVQTL